MEYTIPKVGDHVPIDRKMYFIVERPYVVDELIHFDEEDNYTSLKVGQIIEVDSYLFNDQYDDLFKAFLKYHCRRLSDDETLQEYEKRYSNAIVGEVYSDGSYNIYHFYTPNKETIDIIKSYDFFVDCSDNPIIIRELERFFSLWEKHHILHFSGIYFGKMNDDYYFYTEYDSDSSKSLIIGTPMNKNCIPNFFAHTKKVLEDRRHHLEEIK